MKNRLPFFAFLLPFLLAGCSENAPEEAEETSLVKTPVEVVSIQNTPITETFTLTATSVYQKKSIINASVQGYIKQVYVSIGDHVAAGKPVFLLRTKEAEVLGELARKDPALAAFRGGITIKAPASGNVQELNFQVNDYVNDGDQLAVIADQSSFAFILNVPFESSRYVKPGTNCTIILPDSTRLPGKITAELGMVDAASQTRQYVVKPQTNVSLPENLLVTVQLVKAEKNISQVVNRQAVLTDETMEKFWVMKLINDTTAVKIPVKKGIVSGEKVELLSPQFQPGDRLLTTGNYGLPDTAYVTVQKSKRP